MDGAFGELKKLFEEQKFCALSTCAGDGPHTSLVAFFVTDDMKSLVFFTKRDTTKYRNMTESSAVSLMVDDKKNDTGDITDALAVTVVGDAHEVEDDGLCEVFLRKHPYLREFCDAPSVALMQVTVRKYYLVRVFQNVVEIDP